MKIYSGVYIYMYIALYIHTYVHTCALRLVISRGLVALAVQIPIQICDGQLLGDHADPTNKDPGSGFYSYMGSWDCVIFSFFTHHHHILLYTCIHTCIYIYIYIYIH